MAVFEQFLSDESATTAFGARLADCCDSTLTLHLCGQLGTGKTTLVRGFLRAKGHAGSVKSPTYTLIEPYSTPQGLFAHLDLYRLSDPEELEWIGIRDLFDGQTTCLIEWPEQGSGVLPPADVVLRLAIKDEGRTIQLKSGSARGNQVIDCLQTLT